MLASVYVRFEGTSMNSRGAKPGVFALANGLAHSGELSADDYAWWRESNDWMNAAYPDPSEIDRTLFDAPSIPAPNAGSRTSAEYLIAKVRCYLELLDRYGVGWVQRKDENPGQVLYKDEVQIVVAPFS
jgi:hypothetical protein